MIDNMKNLFLDENNLTQKNEASTTNNVTHYNHTYKMVGFEIKEVELDGNCIIFCYNDYKTLKSTYNTLKNKTPSQIQLIVIVAPLDECAFNLVVKFINRNKDCYLEGYIPKDIESDESRERQFLSNINGFNKIIYVGDVIKVVV